MTWFGKKKTPDGTTIIHHKPAERRLGFTDQTTFAFLQAREAVYQRLFLEALSVSHEVLPQVPHIDVYTFQRSRDSQTTTVLVTGGMSDSPMTVHPVKWASRAVWNSSLTVMNLARNTFQPCDGWRTSLTTPIHGLATGTPCRTEIPLRHSGGARPWTRFCLCRRSS